MIDFFLTLLTAPIRLAWLLLAGAAGFLLLLSWLTAWVVAFVHAHAGTAWKDVLLSNTRVKISWTWGWLVACAVLLLYVAGLGYLDRVGSWIAALPYLLAALFALLFATMLRHSVRKKVVDMQKVVQGARQ